MTHGENAAMRIDLRVRNIDFPQRNHCYHRQSFIDLESIDVADSPTAALHQLLDGSKWSG
jgi:hypothetical protein